MKQYKTQTNTFLITHSIHTFQDVLYLTPYLNEVLAEIKEKQEWDKE